jgi:hypothetical protein
MLAAVTAGVHSCSLFDVHMGGPQLNGPSPSSTDAELDTWWGEMQTCRTEQLALFNYSAKAFANPALTWTQDAFAIPMIQGYDRMLYDETRNVYTVDRYLDDVEKRFGGNDAVFLTATCAYR